jgi:two-component system cell cycle sensor histidine kinase/response regulator CckA
MNANAEKQIKGCETVLLVDDEDIVRKLAAKILTTLGYEVLAASDGVEAISHFNNHDKPIDLLLTDMVMPKMNGIALYEQMKLQHPELKVLYMSGYTDSFLFDEDKVETNAFIQKPFSYVSLALKVREVIEESTTHC